MLRELIQPVWKIPKGKVATYRGGGKPGALGKEASPKTQIAEKFRHRSS